MPFSGIGRDHAAMSEPCYAPYWFWTRRRSILGGRDVKNFRTSEVGFDPEIIQIASASAKAGLMAGCLANTHRLPGFFRCDCQVKQFSRKTTSAVRDCLRWEGFENINRGLCKPCAWFALWALNEV